MPFSKSIFLFILAFYCHSNLVYSQSKQHILTKKYSPKPQHPKTPKPQYTDIRQKLLIINIKYNIMLESKVLPM